MIIEFKTPDGGESFEVALSDDQFDQLERHAELRGMTVNDLIVDIIDKGIATTNHHRRLTGVRDLSVEMIAQLRADVARGSGHECDEWRDWRDPAGRCLLCDRPLPPSGVRASSDGTRTAMHSPERKRG